MHEKRSLLRAHLVHPRIHRGAGKYEKKKKQGETPHGALPIRHQVDLLCHEAVA